MSEPGGVWLAEFNFGTLLHDWGDPRIAGFQDAIAAVNALAARSPGFVWRLDDAAMEAVQTDPNGVFGGHPRVAATLSVWRDAGSLAAFVERTVHGRFLRRGAEWFEPADRSHLVLWWVPEGHLPSPEEGMDRFLMRHVSGDSDAAFGFDWLRSAGLIGAASGNAV